MSLLTASRFILDVSEFLKQLRPRHGCGGGFDSVIAGFEAVGALEGCGEDVG